MKRQREVQLACWFGACSFLALCGVGELSAQQAGRALATDSPVIIGGSGYTFNASDAPQAETLPPATEQVPLPRVPAKDMIRKGPYPAGNLGPGGCASGACNPGGCGPDECGYGNCQPGQWSPPGIACPWPRDEYICDGGDKAPGAAVGQDLRIRGLHLEDTIAHYDTLDGRTIVEPSNKVCIYAPRFAAVRKVDGPILARHRDRPAGVLQPVQGARADDLQIATTALQPIQPVGELGLKRATIFKEKQGPVTDINEQSLAAFQDRFKPYEDFLIIKAGIHQNNEKARLAQRVQAAIVWTRVQAVQVMLEREEAHTVIGDQRAQATFFVDLPSHPQLRICKVASTSFARPGETVDFTLRFDNTGNQTINNVTIVDNLTTRLEYVEGTAQSSLDACFNTQVNEGDSLVLRWELKNPLPPGEGGIIRFQCRVR